MSLLLSLFELIEGKEHLYPLLDGDANPGPEHTQTSCCRKAACLPGSVGLSVPLFLALCSLGFQGGAAGPQNFSSMSEHLAAHGRRARSGVTRFWPRRVRRPQRPPRSRSRPCWPRRSRRRPR